MGTVGGGGCFHITADTLLCSGLSLMDKRHAAFKRGSFEKRFPGWNIWITQPSYCLRKLVSIAERLGRTRTLHMTFLFCYARVGGTTKSKRADCGAVLVLAALALMGKFIKSCPHEMNIEAGAVRSYANDGPASTFCCGRLAHYETPALLARRQF